MRPWTSKPVKKANLDLPGVPSLMDLCLDMIANNLHTFQSIDFLPSHLLKDILDRRKNENMQHGDDAHKANNGDIKADANGNQSTRMGGIISRTACN